MIKVKFKTLSADANGVFNIGQIVEVDDKEAKALVSGGFADYIDSPAPEVVAEEPKKKRQKKAE